MGQAQERLPWLSDEPVAAVAAAPPAPAAPAASRRSTARVLWPFYLLLVLLIAAVAAGAWWLGTQQREPRRAELPLEEPVALPIGPPAPTPPQAEVAPGGGEPALPPPTAAPAAPPLRTEQAPASTIAPTVRPSAPAANDLPAPAAAASEEQNRSVFPADEPLAAPPPLTGPRPIVVYHPQPNRGRVVQLGAFPTRAQADQAWRRITRRYPYLSGKPKMVNTVDVRGLGGGRGTRMYRLQLGTSSQAQSAVICQQLERAGQSCVVVY